MSFRDNLQHLRATRNMTQEQLAMLLGVSRQSVTKWEAEKSYPEMDKLLKLCRIFDCTLDDLVQGDLTARAPEPEAASVPAGPPADVCGYDEHQRMMALKVPTGISVILAACGIGMLFEGRAAPALWGDADTIMVLIILFGIFVGLAFCIPAGMESSAFKKAHPFVEDFYTEDDRTRARKSMARGATAGIGLIFVGVACIMVLGANRETEQVGLCLLLLFIAAGVWLIVHFGMMLGRTNLAEYNRSVAEELEFEEIVNAKVDDELREAMLARKRADQKIGAVCGAIMIVATIVGLAMLFAPALTAPDPSSFEPEGTSAMWFWAAWPVGGMVCGIVVLLMRAFGDTAER